ncbi:hypothetical protein H2248_010908 [Termitomyces sp. 'cryptogamus']|nr:hypothetical protein H2248_010908 [Termitomyces sp. 'cryptogamus']
MSLSRSTPPDEFFPNGRHLEPQVETTPLPQTNGAEGVDPRLKDPIHSERRMKIICIGAGASGLLLAYKLQRSFNNFELVLYEKNEDISGTWFENRYPGCVSSD